MLRGIVLALAALLFGAALAAWPASGPAGLGPVLAAGLLLAAVAFERVRYKRLAARAPGPGFRPTAERFVDPATGARVTVWTDAGGERAYVRE